ncbi:MAG: N-formylglutamate amidohydrolase [Nanoarchaeota archaeon]|nr:N-formylglutamate amidohydrolase [Nanoarchaeota archaeon]
MVKFNDFFERITPRKVFEQISPILINPTSSGIQINLSRRFLIFQLLEKLTRRIEDDPYLNFISILKNYKVLGNIITGNLHELHRDRNTLYFKNFFIDRELYKFVKADLEWVYDNYEELRESLKLTITKRGIIVYDNHQQNQFNVLLLTIHSGTWIRRDIEDNLAISREKRLLDEDIDTDKIYGPLVLDKGGIWIDNKASRFACDYNRGPDRRIYANKSECWIKEVWKEGLSMAQKNWLIEGYEEFYFTLDKLIDAYKFNIIFDGHSMKDAPGRPLISFGTKYIPSFYMPIVRSMQRKMNVLGYNPVSLNVPYSGGFILQWLSQKYPAAFTLSMEVNKLLYMTKNWKSTKVKMLNSVSKNISFIFDIQDDDALQPGQKLNLKATSKINNP